MIRVWIMVFLLREKSVVVDMETKELTGQQAFSPTTIHGWPAVIFSLPFVASGVFIILMSLNIILTPGIDYGVKFFLPVYAM